MQTAFRLCDGGRDKCYLFVLEPKLEENGTVKIPKAYWTSDPDGNHPLSQTEMFSLGIVPPIIELSFSEDNVSWTPTHLEGLALFHKKCGFDPFSNDVSRFLQVPRAHLLWKSSEFSWVAKVAVG